MAKSTGILAPAAIRLALVFFLLVTVTARVLPIHPYLKIQDTPISQLYDTSNYGFLQIDNGLARTPQMGWSTWNFFACNINETVIKETVDALISNSLASLGYNYVNIGKHVKNLDLHFAFEGEMVPDPKTFSSGIKTLADYVHLKGLKLMLGLLHVKFGQVHCFMKKMMQNFGHLGYPPMCNALNATGWTIFYTLCEWGVDDPALWAGKIGNSWRTTDDINDTWARHPMLDQADGTVDPDMLEVGNGDMNYHENITAETLEILSNKEVLSVDQDPLGVQGRRVYASGPDGCQQFWAGPLSGNRLSVVLWNRCLKAATITAEWDAIGLEPSISMKLFQRTRWARLVPGLILMAVKCTF
ncbi:hypothetical protein RND71_030557 [Anisodus tanguticus]|uniref:Alpha-galactosidase n=1 Tax=Anisodus tanguticus TaxID=243964 RepID=A0AAE1RHE6_9SOLA|nr:hypothetical protein RND71_030557 [Anisodus tanguticus]